MLCDDCKPWAPTTYRQLRLRQKNIQKFPEVGGYPCPNCHSTNWLTSTEMIHDPAPTRLLARENFRMFLGLIASAIILATMYIAVFYAPCDGTFWRGLRSWYHLECPS